MKTLETLVRLHKWRLNEKRRQLTELQRLRDELHKRDRMLEDELQRETAAAAGSLQVGHVLSAFRQSLTERRDKLAVSLDGVLTRIAEVREEITDAFREFKRHETLLENQRKKLHAKQERRARLEQDEVALNMHRHRRNPDGLAV